MKCGPGDCPRPGGSDRHAATWLGCCAARRVRSSRANKLVNAPVNTGQLGCGYSCAIGGSRRTELTGGGAFQMRKGIIIRALIAMSLVSVFLAGGRDAAFAHAQLAGAPRTP